MRPIKEQQHEHARNLFFQSGKTRAQIAEEVGVSERSIYSWTKEGDWKRLRSASKRMPSLIVENFYSQVQELNDNIRSRQPGMRYPSIQEAETFRKLVLTAERMKKRNTQPEYMEMFQKFMQWLTPQNHDHLQLFTNYADGFLKSRSVDGFCPYDIEYNTLEPPLPKEPSPSLKKCEPAIFPVLMTSSVLTEGSVPETTNVVSQQEHIPPSPITQSEQNDISHNTSLSFGEDWGEAQLAPNTSTDDNKTSSPSEGPGEVSLAQEIIEQEPEKLGNNSNKSYDAPTNTFTEINQPKEEITNEQEITQALPSEGDSPDSTNVENGQRDVTLGKAPKPGKDSSVEIGYLGQKQKPERGDAVMIHIQQQDPDIQKFSIGNAIYYIKRKD